MNDLKKYIRVNSQFVNFSTFLILLFGLIKPAAMSFQNGKTSTSTANSELVSCQIEVSNLEPVKSSVYIAIFDGAETFMSDTRFDSIRIDSDGKSTVFQTFEIPKGKYGMAVFQDLNGNGKLDKNIIGIPSEPYGFSNNASGTFGPPSWAEAVVDIDKAAKVKIEL